MRYFFAALAAIALGLFVFTRVAAPASQLNTLDTLMFGGSGVSRVAKAVVFDDATQLKLDVWAPKQKTPTKLPVLVFFYGGGWNSGERAQYAFAGKAYASKGFVVVLADYRKVPQVRFPAFVEDGANAVRWVQDNIEKFRGDPKRVTLAGHSAGAYIAMMLALDSRFLSSAGVVPGFVRATVGLAGSYDFLPFDSVRAINTFSRWPKPSETQPIFFAHADAPPIMVLTGTHDDTVKPRNAINMARRLRELGARAEFKAYPDLTHEGMIMAISKPFRGKGSVLDDSSLFLLENSRLK